MSETEGLHKMVIIPTEEYDKKSDLLRCPKCGLSKKVIIANRVEEYDEAKRRYECAYCLRNLKIYDVREDVGKLEILEEILRQFEEFVFLDGEKFPNIYILFLVNNIQEYLCPL